MVLCGAKVLAVLDPRAWLDKGRLKVRRALEGTTNAG